ncbi:alpha/beta hydrolase [Kaustia mangrovi]|uniref:Alpha/beta hydrolase n=1 Tax=Kaustia mangrovi TaxID=2593653 RepID=A0A7S8HC13_9HYPH|nr:alpha/beta hydrolase [Kaustia mangrovi]QPC43242.1 alpha/beta hydrolase [Kaustia mangrovi]
MTLRTIGQRIQGSLFCIVAIAFIAAMSAGTAFAATPEGWSRTMVEKGDVHLEIFERGSGKTVLMHPSLGRPAQDFVGLANSVVEAGYHVVLINPRGIGASTGPMDKVKLQDLGNDVWMVADRLKLDKVFMLGQNFGNRVSRTVSSLQPDRVIGLVLLACGGEIEPDKATWEVFWKMYDPSLSPKEHREAVASSMFAKGNDPDAFLDGWHQKTAKLQASAAERTDFKPLFNGGTAPALVVQGLQDKIAPPQNAFDFVTNRPDARLVAFPDMGHAMLPEQPKHISDAVINFLNDQQ